MCIPTVVLVGTAPQAGECLLPVGQASRRGAAHRQTGSNRNKGWTVNGFLWRTHNYPKFMIFMSLSPGKYDKYTTNRDFLGVHSHFQKESHLQTGDFCFECQIPRGSQHVGIMFDPTCGTCEFWRTEMSGPLLWGFMNFCCQEQNPRKSNKFHIFCLLLEFIIPFSWCKPPKLLISMEFKCSNPTMGSRIPVRTFSWDDGAPALPVLFMVGCKPCIRLPC